MEPVLEKYMEIVRERRNKGEGKEVLAKEKMEQTRQDFEQYDTKTRPLK